MAKHPELTGFIPTIKKPERLESLAIIAAQVKTGRQIVCTFNAGEKTERTTTRIPKRHANHQMKEEVDLLVQDMQAADFVQIIDLKDR